jgi:hypothetical protein
MYRKNFCSDLSGVTRPEYASYTYHLPVWLPYVQLNISFHIWLIPARCPFAYHYVYIWKSQLFRLRWALVIFGSGKKEHPSPRTLVGRTWRVKWVRVPTYAYIAHRIKMYILDFPGMCPVYGRYSGPKNRFEDSLKTCKDKFRSMLVMWWQLLIHNVLFTGCTDRLR